jgi:hypothetical protein
MEQALLEKVIVAELVDKLSVNNHVSCNLLWFYVNTRIKFRHAHLSHITLHSYITLCDIRKLLCATEFYYFI